MKEKNIDKLVNEAMDSLDGTQRAEAKPFLITRVLAAINNKKNAQNFWTRAGSFISRPGVAISGISVIVLLNLSIVFFNANGNERSTAVRSTSVNDDFAASTVNLYDIENPE